MPNFVGEYPENKSDALGKQIARHIIKYALNLLPLNSTILTFPHLNFELEKYALSLGYKVICLERTWRIHEQQVNICNEKGLDIELIYIEAIDFFRLYDTSSINLAFLDFMGSISDEIIQIAKFSVIPHLFVTLKGGREHTSKHSQRILRRKEHGELGDVRSNYIKQKFRYQDYKPMGAGVYHYGNSMHLYQFQLTNKDSFI
jgi:hypothetical protein